MYKRPLISFIVPVYNTQDYLRRCIDSISAQTYKNLEIIIVNDGSEDLSQEICDSYLKSDPRVIVIHTSNRGAMSARKTGVALAKGDYIGFVDSDDYIDNDLVEKFLDAIYSSPTEDLDAFLFGYIEETERYKKSVLNRTREGFYGNRELVDLRKRMLSGDFFGDSCVLYEWTKIYKSTLVKDEIVKVPNEIVVGEDAALSFAIFNRAQSLFVSNTTPYHYCIRETSIMYTAKLTDISVCRLFKKMSSELSKFEKEEFYKKMELQVMYFKWLYLLFNDYSYACSKFHMALFPFGEIKEGSRVVLYGAGDFGKKVYDYILSTNSVCLLNWVDKRFEKEDKYNDLCSDKITVKDEAVDYIFIAIRNEKDASDVALSLVNNGFSSSKIKYVSTDLIYAMREELGEFERIIETECVQENDTKLSVVVPIYNSEDYLCTCLDSLTHQTFRDLEIILVNDGSTDSSGKICEDYIKKDSRVKIIHKSNGGLVSSRKAGVAIAIGEYVGFVDSDDFVDATMYEDLFFKLQEKDIEVIAFGYIKEQGAHSLKVVNRFPSGCYKNDLLLKLKLGMLSFEKFGTKGILSEIWAKLVKRDVIAETIKLVPDSIVIGEDVAITYDCILKSKSMVVFDCCPYHYVQRKTSMIHSRDISFVELATLLKKLESDYSELKIVYPNIVEQRINRFITYLLLLSAYEKIADKDDCLVPFTDVSKGSRIVVYGAGTFGQKLSRYIKNSNDYDLVAVVDTNFDKINIEDVVSPEDVFKTKSFDLVIIAVLDEEVSDLIKKYIQDLDVDSSKIKTFNGNVMRYFNNIEKYFC